MGLKFFTISVQDDGAVEEELNAFLRSHRVLAIDRRWVDQGTTSFWAVCVDYLEQSPSGAGSSNKRSQRGKVDYRDVLSPEDFAVFASLRELRKEIAQADAVPVYTIFTNEQLAKMVQQRATTKAALEEVAGVGDARITKYGDRVLEFLQQQWNGSDEASGKSV